MSHEHRTSGVAAALTAVIALLSCSASASAAIHERDVVQNASGSCLAAMPSYDTLLRKRPLAMQNDGQLPTFVTCSLVGTARGVGGIRSTKAVYVYADNNSDRPLAVSCTLVDSVSGFAGNYLPKTLVLPPHSTLNEFHWDAAANGGLNFAFTVNTSCSLPAGAGLSVMFTVYDENTDA